ncbi:MAG: hypothetical protein IT463_01045 [Planctomycetes bacterium]|nr:hypothetical protein [Planctomycetota bacterium]
MSSRYVILHHTGFGEPHFDLMLEVPGQAGLRTIALACWPLSPGQSCPVRELPAHRAAYLDYEGEVSGGRGRVARVETGTWHAQGELLVLTAATGGIARVHLRPGVATATS